VPSAFCRFRKGAISVIKACAEALSLMDGLIKEQPGNPYFQEMKGQALLRERSRPQGDRAASPRFPR